MRESTIGFNIKLEEWIVKEFSRDHDTFVPIDTQFLQSHQILSNSNKPQLHAKSKVGFKTSQIMNYIIEWCFLHKGV